MGIGALRRYHAPATSASPKDAEVAPGATDTDEAVKAAETAEAAKLAREQQEQADAANAHPNTSADNAEGSDQFAEGAGSNGGDPADTSTEFATAELPDGTKVGDGESLATLPVAESTDEDGEHAAESVHPVIVEAGAETDTKHGEIEQPNRGSSTEAWRTYAKADSATLPFNPDEAGRDTIAEFYLGAKA